MHTILLIDDDPQIRTSFGFALRQHGYHLVEAHSGEAGLEAAKTYLPDLILTDINMPGGDGKALLHHLRQSPELKAKQVVLMTGRPDLVSARMGMEAGADDFLVKPVSIETLISCVEARLSRAAIHWRVEDRKLDHLRSSLLSTLPHEVFTPLAGMMALSDYLRVNATGISLELMEELHNEIYSSGLLLHRTLTNYFRVLGLENEASKLEGPTLLAPTVFRAAVKSAIDDVLARPGPPRNILVQVSETPVFVEVNNLKILVEELVDNARKFSGKGTEIIVGLNEAGTLTVVDQGRGMSAEQVQQIRTFQHFDRDKHAQPGLGLGLLLARKLAERNGATFALESELGRGTQVAIAFRMEPKTAVVGV